MKDPNTVVGPYDDVLDPAPVGEDRLGGRAGRRHRRRGPVPGVARGGARARRRVRAVARRVRARVPARARRQWDKGKSCETFNPLGPWLVPADEVADPQDLGLRLWVNGELRQDGSTSPTDLPRRRRRLVPVASSWCSSPATSSTPAPRPGVALGIPGSPYLRAGDVVELEIDGLGGSARSWCRHEPANSTVSSRS